MEEKIIWHGYEGITFEFEDRQAMLVFPKQADAQKNWTLKMEYWDSFPKTELALLEKGFHAAYLKNRTRWATKDDCDIKARFVDYLHKTYGLRDKCVPVGMSCGGAHAVNFAGFYPEKTACLFIDAPVLNFCANPGRLNNPGSEKTWETEFLVAYPGMTRDKLLGFDNHPIGKVDILKAHNIPILMLYGTEDKTVDYLLNGKLLELAYENNPLLKVIPRMLEGHHPHGLDDPAPIVDFILQHI